MNGIFKLSVIPAVAALVALGPAQTLKSSHQTTQVSSPAQGRAGVPSRPVTTRPVARVNGVEISGAAFDAEMRQIFPYYSIHGNAVPKEYEADVRKKAINNLIDAELAYQEAQRRHLQITPLERQKRIAEIRKDYRTSAEFQAAIVQLFGSRQAFEKSLLHDMLLDKIFRLEVKNKAVVTDKDVREFYDKDKSMFAQPRSAYFQTISVLFPKNAGADVKQAARKRIEAILPKARATKTHDEFGLLAEKVSEDDYRVMMGDRGQVFERNIAPEFVKVFSMKAGEVSGIIESPVGYHIVRVNKHEEARQLSFVDVRSQIRSMLEKDKLQARNRTFHEALRKAAKIEVL